jgi:Universal stress protein family
MDETRRRYCATRNVDAESARIRTTRTVTLMNRPTPAAPNRGMIYMFKHILIPTDGSKLSEAAIQAGVQFAKSINAKVTGFHAMPKFHVLGLWAGIW